LGEGIRGNPLRRWLHGTGLAVYAREAPGLAATSVRLIPVPGGRIRAEVPISETGAGSHTVVRKLLAAGQYAGSRPRSRIASHAWVRAADCLRVT
jgi:hypothetical protein